MNAPAQDEEGQRESALRGYLARILGWSDEQSVTIEHALRSIALSVTHRAALVLLGVDADLVSVAQALHRLTLGADHPFVFCDRRRTTTRGSVRAPSGYASGVVAAQAARGGSLCIRRRRLPRDFSSAVAMVREPSAAVQLIICGSVEWSTDPFLALPAPIQVPALSTREHERPRLVDEYARDAIETLGAAESCFPDDDRAWVLEHATGTLAEIEKATKRLVALRMTGTLTGAAERLGMSVVALRLWIHHRRLHRRGEAPR